MDREKPRLDYYTTIHKTQRRWVFDLSNRTATTDFADASKVKELIGDIGTFLSHLRDHDRWEKDFFQPVLAAHTADIVDDLEGDHAQLEAVMAGLEKLGEGIANGDSEDEKRYEHGLEYYRALNRFIAQYLEHIDHEESLMPLFWWLCTDEELSGAMGKFVGDVGSAGMMQFMEIMLPAVNLTERTKMLMGVKRTAPPEALEGVYKIAEKVLSADDWSALKTAFGI